MHIRSLFIFACALTAVPLCTDAKEDPKNIVAAQIRDQGYECRSPQNAKRDPKASRPDEAVWLLQCENASYRVRLIPHKAAKVERIDSSK